MRNNYVLTILAISFLFWGCNDQKKSWTLTSPNGLIKVEITNGELVENGYELNYRVFFKSNNEFQLVIDDSPLGVKRYDSRFVNGLKDISEKKSFNLTESYSLVSGKQKNCTNIYNQLSIEFKNTDNKKLGLDFKCFNNGVAFRYSFPEKDEQIYTVYDEVTGFKIQPGRAWIHPYDTVTMWNPAYETFYQGPIQTGTSAPKNKRGWAFPMLFETDHCWLLISETGLDGSYGASHVQNAPNNRLYSIVPAEFEEAFEIYDQTSQSTLPWIMPWRFITIGDLSTIVSSNMAFDLASPRKIQDTSWITTGYSSWSWWSDSPSPTIYDRLVPFVDLSEKMNWPYSLVDANWDLMENGNLKDLAEYAKSKGVKLLVWYNSGGPHNVVTERPRDIMNNDSARLVEFKKLNEMGIAGIKVDFFQSDKQEIIEQYIHILEDAAKFQLVVNFHGCTLPHGWGRTYPNLLTTEAIRGGECYKFDASFPALAPAHIATIPFIRGVVGPTDYTPGTFSNNTHPRVTRIGFELALPIIIESGITHICDNPKTLLDFPDFAIDFLRNAPTTWDETRLLQGYPSRDLVIARRHDKKWYIGAINAEKTDKKISVNLNSLNINAKEISMITDDIEKDKLVINTLNLNEGIVEIPLKSLGGGVAIIE